MEMDLVTAIAQGLGKTFTGIPLGDLLPHSGGSVGDSRSRLPIAHTDPEPSRRTGHVSERACKPFPVPPVGSGVTETAGEDFGLVQGDEGRLQSAETGAGEEMIPGSKRWVP